MSLKTLHNDSPFIEKPRKLEKQLFCAMDLFTDSGTIMKYTLDIPSCTATATIKHLLNSRVTKKR